MIREAGPSDAAAIAEVHVETWRDAYSGIVPQAFLDALSISERAESWMRAIENPNESVTVAVRDDSVVGFLAGGDCRDAELPDYSEIYAVYVRPDCQRASFGYGLTKGFLEDTRLPCSLWVLEHNAPARRFYEKIGFRSDGATKQISIGGADLAEVRYTLQRSRH